ncbi:MAG: ShlB/FhaC/HecB family hemolysin secretion/activation protein [Desulfamplus sp.]|nr:ShlB/FhaC/HecB family hemolysin secretion/activation protein [Desulfamplus sp.]
MKTIFHTILAVMTIILFFTTNSFSGNPNPFTSLTHKPKDSPKLPKYLPEEGSPESKKNFTLPPVPEKRTPQSEGESQTDGTDKIQSKLFELKGVKFEGNTLFSNEQLNEAATPFINHSVGMAELEEIRYQITRYYIDRGYINSGALIKPNQKVTDGIVTYLIIEGKLTNINIKGNGRLRENYIKKRVWKDGDKPFNTHKLQDYFQMLLQDPLIDKMDGNIVPGIKPGEAELDIDITRARPYDLSITASNHSSPNLGSEKLSINQTVRNLTGFGDSLNAVLDFTEGTQEIDASYAVPINSNNTTLALNYNYSRNEIVSKPFDSLNIESRLQSTKLSLNHPIYHTLRRDISMGVSVKSEETRTYIIDGSFSVFEGSDNGVDKATVVQLTQSFDDRTTDQVMVLRSTFSFGVDMLSPTLHSESLPDGEFVAWLGQVQYARRFDGKAGQIIFKGNVQLADDRLFSMEQFSLGGADSVRGYRENKHTGDNGYLFSLEWRVPVWESQKTGHEEQTKLLQIAPFMDYGSAWDRDHFTREATRSDNTLHSVGIGLLWSTPKLDAQIYYGYAIEDDESDYEYDIQDDGIHFSVTYNFF